MDDSDELKPLGKCAGLVSKAMSRTSLAMLTEKEIFQNQKRIGNNFECEFFHQGFYSNPANYSNARMFKFQKSLKNHPLQYSVFLELHIDDVPAIQRNWSEILKSGCLLLWTSIGTL